MTYRFIQCVFDVRVQSLIVPKRFWRSFRLSEARDLALEILALSRRFRRSSWVSDSQWQEPWFYMYIISQHLDVRTCGLRAVR